MDDNTSIVSSNQPSVISNELRDIFLIHIKHEDFLDKKLQEAYDIVDSINKSKKDSVIAALKLCSDNAIHFPVRIVEDNILYVYHSTGNVQITNLSEEEN